MLRTITPEEMRSTEQSAFTLGESSLEAMKCAASGLYRAVFSRAKYGLAVFVCGGGGNGGDGFYCAKKHIENGGEALVYYTKAPSGDSLACFRELQEVTDDDKLILLESADAFVIPKRACALVDCLFGTGLAGEVSGFCCEIIEKINASGVYTIACDIPSGLSGLSGLPLGIAVKADETITFHRPKQGLFLARGRELSGRVSVCPLCTRGLKEDGGLKVLEASDIPLIVKKRADMAYKGSAGKLLVIAGHLGMAGAAALCAMAAFRTGVGLVRILTEKSAVPVVQCLCPSATAEALSEESVKSGIEWADALALGPGLGTGEEACGLLFIALASQKPKVVDADALNLLALAPMKLESAVITPHIGEAQRLLGAFGETLSGNSVEDAKRLSELYGAAALLKGHSSIVASSEETYVNTSGCSGMAVGGSGDVLTGIIGALLADRDLLLSCGTSAALGMLIHGLAGESAAARVGSRSMMAQDELDGIAEVLRKYGR